MLFRECLTGAEVGKTAEKVGFMRSIVAFEDPTSRWSGISDSIALGF